MTTETRPIGNPPSARSVRLHRRMRAATAHETVCMFMGNTFALFSLEVTYIYSRVDMNLSRLQRIQRSGRSDLSCNASLRMWSSAEASPADLRPLRQCSSFTPSAPHCCSGYPGISAAALQARCMTYCRSLMTRLTHGCSRNRAAPVRDIGGSTRFRALLCLLLLGTASVFRGSRSFAAPSHTH